MRIHQILFIGFLLLCPAASFADEPPNIVFIISDDQDNAHLGFLGNDVVHTPSLDKLAAAGTVFRNCYLTALALPPLSRQSPVRPASSPERRSTPTLATKKCSLPPARSPTC